MTAETSCKQDGAHGRILLDSLVLRRSWSYKVEWWQDLEEALKRKDAIIRVRNAQISALWDELHTRQPWTNALSGDAPHQPGLRDRRQRLAQAPHHRHQHRELPSHPLD